MKYCIYVLLLLMSSCSIFSPNEAKITQNHAVHKSRISNKPTSTLAIKSIINDLAINISDLKNNLQKTMYINKQIKIYSNLVKITPSEKRKHNYKNSLISSKKTSNTIETTKQKTLTLYVQNMNRLCKFNSLNVENIFLSMISKNNIRHGYTYDSIHKHSRTYCYGGKNSEHILKQMVIHDFLIKGY